MLFNTGEHKMDWDNFYIKFAVVFITFAVFFMGFYYTFSPIQNCQRELWKATHVYDPAQEGSVRQVRKECDRNNSW